MTEPLSPDALAAIRERNAYAGPERKFSGGNADLVSFNARMDRRALLAELDRRSGAPLDAERLAMALSICGIGPPSAWAETLAAEYERLTSPQGYSCLNCNDTGFYVLDGARRPCLWDHVASPQDPPQSGEPE